MPTRANRQEGWPVMLTDEQIYILGALKEQSRNGHEITERVARMSLGKTVLTREGVDELMEGLLMDGFIRPRQLRSSRAPRQRFEITLGGRAALIHHIQQVLDDTAAPEATNFS